MNIQPKMKEFAIPNPIEVLKNSECGIVYKMPTIMALKVWVISQPYQQHRETTLRLHADFKFSSG